MLRVIVSETALRWSILLRFTTMLLYTENYATVILCAVNTGENICWYVMMTVLMCMS
jgi:hypothetical protein